MGVEVCSFLVTYILSLFVRVAAPHPRAPPTFFKSLIHYFCWRPPFALACSFCYIMHRLCYPDAMLDSDIVSATLRTNPDFLELRNRYQSMEIKLQFLANKLNGRLVT